MRKLALGLMASVLVSLIASHAANAGRQVFFHRPVFFHQRVFFHRPFFFHQRFFFHQPFFFHRPVFFQPTFFSFGFFGFPLIFPPPVFAPAYSAYADPTYEPTTAVQQTSGVAPTPYWYYCDAPKGYYPYVQSCSAGWRQVPTMPPVGP